MYLHGESDGDGLPTVVTVVVIVLMVGGAAVPCITMWRRTELGGDHGPLHLSKTDWVDRARETSKWQELAKQREAQMKRQRKADRRLQERILSDLGVDRRRKQLEMEQLEKEEQGPLQGIPESVQEV